MEPIKITREQANEIIKSELNTPARPAVVCYRGWWDVRGMTQEEVNAFAFRLINQNKPVN